MPIENLVLVGDWNRRGSFQLGNLGRDTYRENSDLIFNNQKAIDKIKKTWQRVPYKFNFYVVNAPKYYTNVKNIANKINDLYPNKIIIATDAINVMNTNNITSVDNYFPMTAWIMAHRIIHTIHISTSDVISIDEYGIMESKLTTILGKTLEEFGIIDDHTIILKKEQTNFDKFNFTNCLFKSNKSYYCDDLWNIIHSIFTMRSARERNLNNPLDYMAELFAQYLITGRITLNKISNTLGKRSIDDVAVNRLNENWENLRCELERDFEQILSKSVGKFLFW